MIHFIVNISRNGAEIGKTVQGSFAIPKDDQRTPQQTTNLILQECARLYWFIGVGLVDPKDIIIHVLTRIN